MLENTKIPPKGTLENIVDAFKDDSAIFISLKHHDLTTTLLQQKGRNRY